MGRQIKSNELMWPEIGQERDTERGTEPDPEPCYESWHISLPPTKGTRKGRVQIITGKGIEAAPSPSQDIKMLPALTRYTYLSYLNISSQTSIKYLMKKCHQHVSWRFKDQ